ncbi:hypothetical protein FOC4_g10007062 [Fusarium odoratissimum]|uniref:AB hydrolase-1 domain-containing protein n=1 Tax=Fusarium oxysporum f. sp. cubense (strain race 4) TaxID=2502994 RepID=N1RR97_FUSC4|nr:hypothetical protein FOC4_g10007062 [Fusarium odoratissimum]
MIICLFFILATFIAQALSLQPPDYSLGKEHSSEHLNRRTGRLSRLEPLSYVNTTRLQVAYYEDGSPDAQVVLLLHGWPYDIHSYTEVAPALVKQGYRVIVPYLRGNGPTTFLHTDTFRSGQQAALGYDIIELLDALSIKKAIFAGYDWDLDRAAETFVNPDYVSVVTHVYRHRLLYAPGDPGYNNIEKALLEQPVISVPTVTLDGLADGNFPPTNGSSSAKYFSGPRAHHQVPGAGHNLPQEKPEAFIKAVLDVLSLK